MRFLLAVPFGPARGRLDACLGVARAALIDSSLEELSEEDDDDELLLLEDEEEELLLLLEDEEEELLSSSSPFLPFSSLARLA